LSIPAVSEAQKPGRIG